jgi:hypothetical protein
VRQAKLARSSRGKADPNRGSARPVASVAGSSAATTAKLHSGTTITIMSFESFLPWRP